MDFFLTSTIYILESLGDDIIAYIHQIFLKFKDVFELIWNKLWKLIHIATILMWSQKSSATTFLLGTIQIEL